MMCLSVVCDVVVCVMCDGVVKMLDEIIVCVSRIVLSGDGGCRV